MKIRVGKKLAEKREFLSINGIDDEESFFGKDDLRYAHFYNDDVIDIIKGESFKDIGQHFSTIGFGLIQDWWENQIDVDIICDKYFDYKYPCVQLNFQISEWEHWAKPWSISTVAKQFEINVDEMSDENIKYWQEDSESVLGGFGVQYFVNNDSLSINSELSKILMILKERFDKTNRDLLTSLDKEAVLTYFQFPEDIKTACKQYLIYFTQFIADMGIEVNTDLKEELNHTLFKIIPKNKDESLDRIREALNLYLNAPNDTSFEIQIANQNNVAAKQWEANYYHLKSQLSLAVSISQAKDSTIEMLQLSNYQYRQLLESHSVKKDSEKEEVIKGILEVKKYEGKGFSIDFAEIFRKLKRIIKH